MIQWVNQGLGGIKETKVLGREEFFINAYNSNCIGYVRAERFIQVINQLPRPFLETMCVIGMLIITLLIIVQNKEFQSIIPTMSLFAVAAFRIVPSMNRIFAAVTNIRYNNYSIEMIYNDLILLDKYASFSEKKAPDDIRKIVVNRENSISFTNAIELRNVCYKYPNADKRF